MLFTFKHLFRYQSQPSSRAPTKGIGCLKPCYRGTASQQGVESSADDVGEWCTEDTSWHTPRVMPVSSLYHASHLAVNREDLHSACLNNNSLGVLFQPQQQFCKPREVLHDLTQRSEACGDIQWHGTVPSIPMFVLKVSTCKQVWHLKSLRLENPDPNFFPAGYD